jgi:hypothetical protein
MRTFNLISVIIIFLIYLAWNFWGFSEDKIIKYEYNGITITRVDKGEKAVTYFYYGNFNDTFPNSYLKAEYPGFNGILRATIIFHPNKTVQIERIAGIFYDDKIDTVNKNLYLADSDVLYRDSLRKKIEDGTLNAIEVIDGLSDNYNTEKIINARKKTKVKVIYPID